MPDPALIPNPEPPRETRAEPSAWRLAAWITGIFALLVGLTILFQDVRSYSDDPLKSAQLKEYKRQLSSQPTDEKLKERIRRLDLTLRQRYFRQLAQSHFGVYLLLGGVGVFVFAVSQLKKLVRQPPMPQPRQTAGEQSSHLAAAARGSVAAVGGVIGVFLFVLSLAFGTALPKRSASGENPMASESPHHVAVDVASLEELKQSWPRFRGADGRGAAVATNAPIAWSVGTGAGIAWKVASPSPGFGSPVAFGKRLFFSGGDAVRREVFCLDMETGRLLWRRPVPGVVAAAATPEIPESTGYAASTVATDGRRVYVIFATGDLAAFTLEGNSLWSQCLGPLKNPYGHATSLATWQDRLIVQLDQGESEAGKSKLYALDGRTGQIVWQRPRAVGSSWATPIVIEVAGKAQIITLAVPWVIAYAATDGTELWRVECLNGEITPSPIFAQGLVIVPSPSEKLLAIRPDGQGNVTKTHVAWTAEDNVPDVTSPTSDGQLIFTVTTPGMLTCFDAKDGKKQWEHDFEVDFHASPSVAAGRVYLFSQKGTAIIVEAARHFKELFRTQMSDEFHASPALVDNRIFLRGLTNLWCLGGETKIAQKIP